MSETLHNTPEKDLYYVAVKLLLRDGQRLLITHDIYGDWDLPGGRIRKNEFNSSLESVIERKVNEELGGNISYELADPKYFLELKDKNIISTGKQYASLVLDTKHNTGVAK